MISRSLKLRIAKGVMRTIGEKASVHSVSFIVSMLAARICVPQDYGVVAVMMIFFAVDRALVDGGLAKHC